MQAAWHAWAVPSRPDLIGTAKNAKTDGKLLGDGTDETARLQAYLDALPTGAVLYFPPDTYRIDGPVSIRKPITIVGGPGTIFDCSYTTQFNVFRINHAGSIANPMDGVAITGIVIKGAGHDLGNIVIDGKYLKNFHVSNVKFNNTGGSCITLWYTTDALVENCVFDDYYHEDTGYGVALGSQCDRTTIRGNFFVTYGRHGVATGSGSGTPSSEWTRSVLVENNYFEKVKFDPAPYSQAVDMHAESIGPMVVRNNVFYQCGQAAQFRGGAIDIENNVIAECGYGVVWYARSAPSAIDSRINVVKDNAILNSLCDGIWTQYSNSLVQNNVISAKANLGYNIIGVRIDGPERLPSTMRVEGNIIDRFYYGIIDKTANPALVKVNNYKGADGTWLKGLAFLFIS
jgi:hypothetical protein